VEANAKTPPNAISSAKAILFPVGPVCRVVEDRGIDGTGAPGEIRTPAPQIRSLWQATESPREFFKPRVKVAVEGQWLSHALQTAGIQVSAPGPEEWPMFEPLGSRSSGTSIGTRPVKRVPYAFAIALMRSPVMVRSNSTRPFRQ
jgi:hypothetical protein